jgi:glutamine synthetase
LWRDGKNLFFENRGDFLSDIAKKYLTGLIKYGPEIQLIPNQWINSYKRLIPGYEAPVYMAWGRKNRSAYIRIPEYREGKENSTRIELRSPDPACNIYLALAIIQSAGIQGVKENLKFLPPEEKDIYEMTKSEMKRKKIKTLSKNLKEALEHFKKSKLARETLGEHIFQKIIQNKEIEWQKYKKAVGKRFEKEVSPYEIKEYLPVL